MTNGYEAFIFDMNGTMVDDMHYHELAWYNILVGELGAPLTKEEVKHQLYGKNEELFERVFGVGRFTKEEVDLITLKKESKYREEFLPDLKLISGLDQFLENSTKHGIKLAIGTAAIPENVSYVLDNLHLQTYFLVIIGPDEVEKSKPDPAVFLEAALKLDIKPESCIVFEDSPKGIEAARRAGMKAVAVLTFHSEEELMNENVLFSIKDYTDSALNQLLLTTEY